MKIINDTEVFEPKECYFTVELDPENDDNFGTMIGITNINYWNENHCQNDCFGSHSLDRGVLPYDFDPVMDATWVSEKEPEEVKKIMLSLGFIELPQKTWND